MANEVLLDIKNLTVNYKTRKGNVEAVNNISLTINKGETIGLVGETGAGKTTTALAIMRLLPVPPAVVPNGEIFFDGEDILKINEKDMKKIRGEKISMIYQDPMTALNPIMTVGEQIVEMIRLHSKCTAAEANVRACEMLEMVGIPAARFSEYPHQFSGGMKQRVVIAIAIACNPELLIADEPTTALDVTIQAQVLSMMRALKKKLNSSLLLITHDLGVVASMCEKIAAMYAGHIVEYGTTDEIFYSPSHEYTKGLINSIPRLDLETKEKLVPIEGQPVDMLNPPAGCPFAPRCRSCMKVCLNRMPPKTQLSETHYTNCWLRQKEEFERGGSK